MVGRNGMHRYNNQDHAMMTAMLTVKNIEAGARVYDIWNVNEDAEYHEPAPRANRPLWLPNASVPEIEARHDAANGRGRCSVACSAYYDRLGGRGVFALLFPRSSSSRFPIPTTRCA